MTRQDIDTEEVARRWLDGESILSIASSYQANQDVIKRRIKWAKETMPDLPWEKRKRTQGTSPTKQYTSMKDGKPGFPTPKPGSIIPSRGLRRRG